MSANARIAIIGGGWAGMAAAVSLAREGRPVTVFESAKTLGGRARTVEFDEGVADNGQHILLGAYRETLALIGLVNDRAAEHLLRQPLALVMPPEFALSTPHLPAPWHLAVGLIAAKGLGIGDRLRAMSLLAALRRLNFTLPQDMPLSELLDRHRQSERLNRFLWHPLCFAALNTPPNEASAQIFLNVLRDSFTQQRADSDAILPRANLTQLFPEPAATFVERHGGHVRTGARVKSLAPQGDSWSVALDHEAQSFTHVICAVSPQRTADLIEALPPMQAIAENIRSLRHQPIYTVYLQYPAGTRLSRPMLGLSHGLGQWVFDRGQLGGPAGLLAIVISASGTHEQLEHADLARTIAAQLASALTLTAAPLWHQVIAEKRATFACTPHLRRPHSRTPMAKLYLAGDYVAGDYPATIEGAVRSGVQCARYIMESQ